MSEEKPAADSPAAPGAEEDLRPAPGAAAPATEPTNQLPPGKLQAIMPTRDLSPERIKALRDAGGPVSPAPAPGQAAWPEGHTTGAFVSAAVSDRFSVEPYRWYQISWAMLLLLFVFVIVPAGAGLLAAWEIGRILHWWG